MTAQHPGEDATWGTADDLLAPINANPANVSVDFTPGDDCGDLSDRVRNFLGGHSQVALFALGDGSVQTIHESIDPQIFRVMGTINDD